MADIVAGFGVPHTPVFPFFVKRDGPDCETAKLFARAEGTARRDAARRDRDVRHRSSQHLLPRCLPIFAVGVDKSFTGPNDEPREMPIYIIPSLPSIWLRISAPLPASKPASTSP